jgi:predicted HTH transcriptional regulator
MGATDPDSLLHHLLALPRETEWVEFKVNHTAPEDIGEYISALSNAAALYDQEAAYIVWGVGDASHEVEGTAFRPHAQKIGNEDLEPWLCRLLEPRVHFKIHEFFVNSKKIVIFEIQPCAHTPVLWKTERFIRVGSYRRSCVTIRRKSGSCGPGHRERPLKRASRRSG